MTDPDWTPDVSDKPPADRPPADRPPTDKPPADKTLAPVSRRPRALSVGIIVAAIAVTLVYLNLATVARGEPARLGPVLERLGAELGLVVEDIAVEGAQRTPVIDVLTALAVGPGAPLMTVDLDAAQARVEALAWVRSAKVSRQLPDRLRVMVVEYQPFARWQSDGIVRLIDRQGSEIPVDRPETFDGLPLLVGAGAADRAHAILATLALEPVLADRVHSLIHVGQRRWDVLFNNGMRLQLPEASRLYGPDQAWRRFAELERRHGLLDRDAAIFDVRQPDRLIVRLTETGRQRLTPHLTSEERTT